MPPSRPLPPAADAVRPLIWPRPGGAGASNDREAFDTEFAALAQRRGFRVEPLGVALGHRILLATRRPEAGAERQLLIAAGFHGEEPAGPWGVLEFLRVAPDALLERVTLGVVPLVNATGFAAGRRFNARGENPNRGYDPAIADECLSAEGAVLLGQRERVLAAARDGLLCCHEDEGVQAAYVYALEPAETPGRFSRGLVETMARFFPLVPDGQVDGCPVADGLVYNRHDGSFESWAVRHGVPAAATVETPGRADFAQRVAAQAALMTTFVELRAPG